jgi:o-succinylbenzoate synthase
LHGDYRAFFVILPLPIRARCAKATANIIYFDPNPFFDTRMSKRFKINASLVPYTLRFKFDAGTSRGVLKSKDAYILQLRSQDYPGICGYGEAGPLKGLSLDDVSDFAERAEAALRNIETVEFEDEIGTIFEILNKEIGPQLPSLKFALETALLDLIQGGDRTLFTSAFTLGKQGIPINGLIWMGDPVFMQEQISKKLEEGYSCIKMKIGALDFDMECKLLEGIRKNFSSDKVMLRVDANGAFTADKVMKKLTTLAAFDLHSIEQPISPREWKLMAQLCRESPIPVALDEELISIVKIEEKIELLDVLMPPYIILKPTLLGGFASCKEWISLAEERGIGWWMTSALESNIGLNAIAQFTALTDNPYHQGLGTGQLYHNNFTSPLSIANGELRFQRDNRWQDLEGLFL